MKVIQRDWKPGETLFGGGKGAVSFNILRKKQTSSAGAGSTPEQPHEQPREMSVEDALRQALSTGQQDQEPSKP